MRLFSGLSRLSGLVVLCAVVLSAPWCSAGEVRLEHSPFGLFYVGRKYVGRAAELNASYVRGIIDWGRMEPEKGVYNFKKLDRAVKAVGRENLHAVLLVRALSSWGGTGSKAGWNKHGKHTVRKAGVPGDMEGWKDFLRTLVDRYDGDGRNDMPGLNQPVKYWQIENEWLQQWKGTPQEYMGFLKASYDVIKKEDPSASVISGGLTLTENAAMVDGFIKGSMEVGGARGQRTVTREKILRGGRYEKNVKAKFDVFFDKGADSFDIVDFHSYTADPYLVRGQAEWVRSMMKKRGYDKPIWSLEHAGPYLDYSESAHSAQVVQRYMIALESGVETICWSSLVPAGNAHFVRLALQDRKGNKKPAYFTYALMTGKLKDATAFVRMDMGDKNIYLYRFTGQGKAVYVGWVRSGSKTISLPWDAPAGKVTHIIVRGENAKSERISAAKHTLKVPLTELPVFFE